MPADAIDDLLHRAIDRARQFRRLPVSTYRLQFHAKFTFRDATKIVPYLAKLGITHVYASPYLAATPGSTHGYDVIDHTRLNPEVGTPEDYDAFLKALKDNGLTHILDTVPNHVGVATNDNHWWNDVLEHGPSSRFANYFDITWHSSARPELQNKVLVPTLGKQYGEALEAGELKLSFDASAGRFWLNYYDRRFPITPSSYGTILSHRAGELSAGADELKSVTLAADRLPLISDDAPASVQTRSAESDSIKKRLAALARSSPAFAAHVETVLADFNGKPGDPASFDRLDALLRAQCFRLADWHVAFDEINYRRFFDVNDLAALKMERPDVFEATHRFTLDKVVRGDITGLRIDHPDGLYNPAEYLKRLQDYYLVGIAQTQYDGDNWPVIQRDLLDRLRTHNDWLLPVWVEKILAMDEPLLPDWATHGTSGYDFLVQLNALFVDPAAEPAFDALWQTITGDATPYEPLAYRNKRMMLETSLASELHTLTYRLDRLAQQHRRAMDFTFRTLQAVLRETIACFGVYRTYVAGPDVTDVDRQHIQAAIQKAKARNPRVSVAAFDFLQAMLLQQYEPADNAQARLDQQAFAGKFQQLTSPVTAKGIEDTTFYQYNRMLSLNEVGGEPARFGISADQFHAFLADRQRHWPFALSGSSTHDTKRSEDVRARLNVLSDMPDEWTAAVKEWFNVNASLRQTAGNRAAPTPADEYLIYQTLLGAWPLGDSPEADFADRIQAYVLKAIREAKTNTRWGEPDEAYEAGVRGFIDALLSPERSAAFHQTFQPLRKKVSHLGLINSLGQTLIKLISPGVPDVYQGTELWDFSLVDPDNRRPVDYQRRRALLDELPADSSIDWATNLSTGRAKLKLVAEGLRLRRKYSDLFALGQYSPLSAEGSKAEHVFGFVREHGGQRVAAVVPLWSTKLVQSPQGLPTGPVWADTRIQLPAGKWVNVLTGQPVASDRGSDVFADWPVALLMNGG